MKRKRAPNSSVLLHSNTTYFTHCTDAWNIKGKINTIINCCSTTRSGSVLVIIYCRSLRSSTEGMKDILPKDQISSGRMSLFNLYRCSREPRSIILFLFGGCEDHRYTSLNFTDVYCLSASFPFTCESGKIYILMWPIIP